MFKLTDVLGLTQSTTKQPHTVLTPLTIEQTMAVSAGNGEPTSKDTPTDKQPVTTTSSNGTSTDTLPNSAGRPPFN